jgi:beta-glucosidase-like glycosyl hydrolase
MAEKKLDPALIDEAVRNILRMKFRLGLFDRAPSGTPSATPAPDALETARALAAASLVLLKNDGVLPLKAADRVAVIGPLADSAEDQMGTWAMNGNRAAVRTPLAALRARLGDARVIAAPDSPPPWKPPAPPPPWCCSWARKQAFRAKPRRALISICRARRKN